MPHAPSSPRTIVIIPTYNEVENLPIIVEQVLSALPATDLLVVDDSSPDGTGDLAERISASDARVHVLHRTTKDGLGRAYLAGFAWGLQRGYDLLIEMDADGSHPADRLPALVEAARIDDERPVAAIGSRWVKGGSVVDWPRRRELLSRWANRYARIMLGLSVHDRRLPRLSRARAAPDEAGERELAGLLLPDRSHAARRGERRGSA